ncbi:uncharacterized protein PGTG_22047 [Puccinia graminis f. sp. tritici CRL 75-36-700-3]|uniref:Uncharacterized protein n=1 Tax=Puccinia graminis f. sp. tritici (strain CRL 75-36-700-3 / race SCCL) TaxID=418459 RepID=H6QTH5_PUCGT|nr:uncharacterized protein PGTG_22047 [Puccinia graminis f. sp. tritici CRL 75-36-700-3]EHS64190.1 hypothetical protein PGTG_22047 [Puccinia graminis f. sp. tritici CRL 75-36-700-3]
MTAVQSILFNLDQVMREAPGVHGWVIVRRAYPNLEVNPCQGEEGLNWDSSSSGAHLLRPTPRAKRRR